MRVLIDVANGRVGDELIDALRRADHVVERGSANISAPRFDVVVVGTPEAAARLTREHPLLPVLVFTRSGDIEARIHALQAGAADAVDATFATSQVAARIGAAGRRAALLPRDPDHVDIDGCTIDLAAHTCEREGQRLPLTRREVDLVRWLVRRTGQVVSRAELLEHVWGVSARNDSRAVDVAMAGLRQKIERDPAAPAIVVTIKGAGYRWG